MAKNGLAIASFIVSIIVGAEALVDFISAVIEGLQDFWAALSPFLRLVLVAIVLYLLFRKDKKK